MSHNSELIRTIKKQLQQHANGADAEKMQAYMKSAMPFYGVKMPVLKQVCREAIGGFPLESFQQWQETVLHLWRNANYREERHCAIQLCEAKLYKQFQTLDSIALYEEMIVTGAWWDYVDVIASHRIGYLLKTYPKAMKPFMLEWANCEDIWKRRTAILSQLSFKQETDLKLLFDCIKPSWAEDEFFLQKAIGWALRAYAWVDIQLVMDYVDANSHHLSRLAQREALKNKEKLLKRAET